MSVIIERTATASEEDCYNDLIEEDNPGFECQKCDFTSDEIDDLLAHLSEAHNNPAPNSTTDEKEDLSQYDENNEKTVVKYMCGLCFTPFPSVAAVKMHMIQDHNLKEKTKVEEPQTAPESTATPPTPPGDYSEFLKLSLVELKAKLTKQSIYRCAIKGCVYKFETPERRDIHLKCHSSYSNVREFKCCDCEEKQKGWRQCCMHLWKVHHIDVDLLKCPVCPFKAKNIVKIFQHLQGHSGSKGYPCLSCSKVFPNYGQLRRHSLSHLDEQKESSTRWYSQKTCHICLNVFANSKTLTKHMKRHSKIVSYRCNICGKGSTNKTTLLIHMRQHTGEKPLKCKVCPFNARDPSVMRKHTMRHAAEKPYKCKHCDFSAIQTVGIKMHVRMNHPEEFEKMKCTLCKFISVSQQLLDRHYKDHRAGLVKTSDEEVKESEVGAAAKLQQSRQRDHRIKPSEVSSDCFLPLESTDPHDPPLDIGGVTIPAHSEDTQFTMFN